MSTQIYSIAAIILSVLFTVQLTMVGVMQVIGAEPIASNVKALGYPVWVRVMVGFAQLMAVVFLWVPKGRLASAMVLVAILLGAVISHLRVRDSLGKSMPAVITFALLLALAFLNYHR